MTPTINCDSVKGTLCLWIILTCLGCPTQNSPTLVCSLWQREGTHTQYFHCIGRRHPAEQVGQLLQPNKRYCFIRKQPLDPAHACLARLPQGTARQTGKLHKPNEDGQSPVRAQHSHKLWAALQAVIRGAARQTGYQSQPPKGHAKTHSALGRDKREAESGFSRAWCEGLFLKALPQAPESLPWL